MRLPCFAIALLWTITGSALGSDIGTLPVKVRDISTHFAVNAKLDLTGPQSASVDITSGSLDVSLAPGQYQVTASAPGYTTISFKHQVLPGVNQPMLFMLVPTKSSPEQEVLASHYRAGYTLIHGYAVDEQGRAMEGVHVRISVGDAETTTNDRGYYLFSVLLPPAATNGYPPTATLTGDMPGYKTIIHRNIVLANDDSGGWALDMKRGTGTEEFDDLPRALSEQESESPDAELRSDTLKPAVHGAASPPSPLFPLFRFR